MRHYLFASSSLNSNRTRDPLLWFDSVLSLLCCTDSNRTFLAVPVPFAPIHALFLSSPWIRACFGLLGFRAGSVCMLIWIGTYVTGLRTCDLVWLPFWISVSVKVCAAAPLLFFLPVSFYTIRVKGKKEINCRGYYRVEM